MSHGYIDPKKFAELGQALLKEAILAVLAEAHTKNREYLTNKEISERAGICGYPRDYGIVRVLTRKLKEDRMIDNRRDYRIPAPQEDQWELVKSPVK